VGVVVLPAMVASGVDDGNSSDINTLGNRYNSTDGRCGTELQGEISLCNFLHSFVHFSYILVF
jgi:hypothetical protein